jgi:dTDP-4-amino-4,6-dideoxygalactose transaminase
MTRRTPDRARNEVAVPKVAVRPEAFARPVLGFPRARDGFRALLECLDLGARDVVLLPAYIGWSPREGSGVFDPVRALGLRFDFYRLTPTLGIDVGDFSRRLERSRPRVVVLIHYFGFPADGFRQAAALARAAGAFVVEDEAHAMLSDLVGGICGRSGDAVLWSFHKLLPTPTGGALVVNPSAGSELVSRLREHGSRTPLSIDPLSYDLLAIARHRRRCAAAFLAALRPHERKLRSLFPVLLGRAVPQTLPVVIRRGSRDDIYFGMNEAGYGVVSLYHTLIDEVTAHEHPEAHRLSRTVLNLPVHQDVALDAIPGFVAALAKSASR